MPKRMSSAHAWLMFALAMARKERCVEAVQALRKAERRQLDSSDLRLAAQVNTRCGRLEQAEQCWLEIEQRSDIEPGDLYMLGSLRVQMSKWETAVQCFEREIASGSEYFLDSARLKLAELQLRQKDARGAKETLASVASEAREYVDGAGLQTKETLLRRADEQLRASDDRG